MGKSSAYETNGIAKHNTIEQREIGTAAIVRLAGRRTTSIQRYLLRDIHFLTADGELEMELWRGVHG